MAFTDDQELLDQGLTPLFLADETDPTVSLCGYDLGVLGTARSGYEGGSYQGTRQAYQQDNENDQVPHISLLIEIDKNLSLRKLRI